jgi:hypothetical protein
MFMCTPAPASAGSSVRIAADSQQGDQRAPSVAWVGSMLYLFISSSIAALLSMLGVRLASLHLSTVAGGEVDYHAASNSLAAESRSDASAA